MQSIIAAHKAGKLVLPERPPNYMEGFNRGYEPECILSAAHKSSGEHMFLMKWKGTTESDMVSAKEANERYPELVIKFYEEHVKFNENSSDEK